MKTIKTALAAGAAAAAVVASTPAGAGTITYHAYQSQATGRCLDSNASGSVYPHACNGGNYQHWQGALGGNTRLKNVSTGRCLDSNANGQVYARPCTSNNSYQTWIRISGYRWQNLATHKCLDGNSSRIYTYPCNGGAYQRWHAK